MSEHTGMGGSYVINESGEKVLVHRTDHPVAQTVAPAAPAAPAASTPVTPPPRKPKPAPASTGTASDNNPQE